MDSNLASQSPETSDLRPSFRKPMNDASHRKYRRHSPVSGSSSPSSSGGLKRDRSASPNISHGNMTKTTDSGRKERGYGERDSARDHDRAYGRRGGDSSRDYDRDRSYGRNRNYHDRQDEYSNSRRNGGSADREYQRYSSRSGQDYKTGPRSEYSKRDDDYDRLSREERWSGERSSRDKGFYEGSRKRKEMEKDRDKNNGRDRYKNLDRDVYLERSKTGSRHSNDDSEMKEESRDRDGFMDGTRDRDKSRDRGRNRDEIRDKSGDKALDTYTDDKVQYKKRDDVRERDRNKEKYFKELDRHSKPESKFSSFYKGNDENERDRYRDEDEGNAKREPKNEQRSEKDSRSLRDGKHQADLSDKDDAGRIQGKGTLSIDERKSAKSTSEAMESSSSMATEAEVTHDLNVAKLAAMKAAELVNKNLGVAGCMSADQKKKLLWGNKKATVSEESANKNPWEMARFDDPDRQEKFNKLMSLSVPCYIWPIVGCQGRIENGEGDRRQRWWAICCREAKGIAAGPRKAIYSRTKTTGWSDCWIRIIGMLVHCANHFLCCSLGEIIAYDLLTLQIYRAARSERNRVASFFCLNFMCHFEFSSVRQYNSMECRTINWDSMDDVYI